MQTEPAVKDLVLVGGGHAHLTVLRQFGMRPLPGVRLTLVSRTSQSPYSGMLPGHIAGHYSAAEMHFDLWALARFAGARFIHAEVTGLDLARHELQLANRPPLGFDVLSLNTGATPSLSDLPRPLPPALTPVKPIDEFASRFEALLARVTARPGGSRIGVVGGGAGGVELILAIRHRLCAAFAALGRDPASLRFELVTAGRSLLESHAPATRTRLHGECLQQGVHVHTGMRVVSVVDNTLQAADGRCVVLDEILWVTQAAPAPWFRASGLPTDAAGFLRVGTDLAVTGIPDLFAAGDCVAVEGHPRPKAGVYAVRQGPLLAENLRRAALKIPLLRRAPQRRALSLIATGPRHAVASWGPLCVAGAWVWRWKDAIDRRFMRRFQQLPVMPARAPSSPPAALAREWAQAGLADPRCGGCGAKVAARVLASALPLANPARQGFDLSRDDAAVFEISPGHVAVQSIDGFRSFLGDPFVFGAIVAAHALSDLHAMGARPRSALAYITLPLHAERLMQRDLQQLMGGITRVLAADGASLIGGHTAEGAELSAALTVNGEGLPAQLWRKDTPRAGDALVLTRPLGVGVLLAGLMQGGVPGALIDPLLRELQITNAAAARVASGFTVHAATDVTGFGLIGHLDEMLRGGGLEAHLVPGAVPCYPGAMAAAAQGIRSSLHRANAVVPDTIQFLAPAPAVLPLLFDPQTAGGLLLAVPAAEADALVVALKAAGCARACVIGGVRAIPARRTA